MVEQDYIMRIIKEMIRMLLKLLFHIDSVNPVTELLKDAEEKTVLQTLLDLIDDGRINEAENRLYEMIRKDASGQNMKTLKIALLFYSYLNDKSGQFLEAHNFSREEIKEGVEYLSGQYGLNGITEAFLKDV